MYILIRMNPITIDKLLLLILLECSIHCVYNDLVYMNHAVLIYFKIIIGIHYIYLVSI